MSLVSSTIPNLINGVSQQPPEIRLPSQCEVQENGISSVVNGLEKRPGTEHVKKLDVSSISGAFIHTIQRDEDESYTLIVGADSSNNEFMKIYDRSGNSMPIKTSAYADVTSSDLSYFDNLTNHSENIVATTVADNTFIINRQKTVSEATSSANTSGEGGTNTVSPSGSDDLESKFTYEGLIYVKQGDYSSKYVVSIKNIEQEGVQQSIAIDSIVVSSNVVTVTTEANHGLATGDAVTITGATDTAFNDTFTDITVTGNTTYTFALTKSDITESSSPASQSRYILPLNTEYKVAYQSPSNTPAQNQEYIGTSKIADILTNGEAASGTNAWGQFSYDTSNLYNTLLGFGGRLPTDSTDEDGQSNSKYKVSLDHISSISGDTFKFTRKGSVIHVQSKVKFQVEVEDSHGNRDIFAFTPDFENDGIPEATKFTDLPAANSPDDFVIRIIGDNTRQQDDYYVKFNKDGSNWKESVAPGLSIHFDMTTMPHRLVRIFDDNVANANPSTNPLGVTFIYEPIQEATVADDGTNIGPVITKNVGGVSTTFQRQGWRSRKVGDNTTNPFPTFLGNTINDIFFHRNRLGFLSDENVIFSEAGNYYNFFATTALTSIDSNPIDVAVSNNQVSILRHAVPFNEALLLFSELQQFKVTAGDALTPTSVSIDVSTQFESSSKAKPTPAGKYVFFPFKRGSFSGIREYFIDFTNEVNDATEVTAHVPQYIPGDVTKLASSSNEDMLVCLSADETKNMYVYRYYWQGNEKLMSSWSVWKFDADILDCEFLGSKLYILFERTDGVYLETLNLSTDTSVGVMEDKTPVLLDRRVQIKSSTSVDTVSDIPYFSSLPSNKVFVTDNARKIAQADVDAYVAADASNVVYVGIPFTFKYEFSKFTYKQNEVPIQTAKLQLRNLNLLYNDSGYFTFNVDLAPYTQTINDGSGGTQSITPRKQYQKIFNGFITNISSVDKYTLLSGTFKGSIFSNASNCKVSLTNDEYLPCAFQSAEWEGFLHLRSQRV